MKHTILTIVMTLLIHSFAYAADTEYQIGVDGVACPFCVYGIEKQLSKLDGIDRMEVDIKAGQVLVWMQVGKTLSEGPVRTAVNKAGFTLRSFTQSDESQ